MHYILRLQIDGFFVAHQLERRGAKPPLLVHRDGLVINVCDEAYTLGARIAMPVREARAILDGRGTMVEWNEEDYRTAQTEWLDICTDFADVIEPCEQNSALIDLSEHPRPSEIATTLRSALERKTGLTCRSGAARCRWIAQVACLLQDPQGIALTLPGLYLAGLGTEWLLPVSSATRERLVLLGYRTIGEVADIPFQTLADQFGDEAHTIASAAKGDGDTNVFNLYPPHSVSVRVTADGEVDSQEGLMLLIRSVSELLGAKLLESDRIGYEVTALMEYESGEVGRRKRSFARPIDRPLAALNALKLMFVRPPKKPIVALRVRMPNLSDAKRVQLDLQGLRVRGEASINAKLAMEKVRRLYGDTAILPASEMVVPRRKRVLRAWKDATGWL